MKFEKYVWIDGRIVEHAEAKVPIMTHSLHYGDAVFEGIRFYKTSKGPAIFRLKEHVKRLLYSASAFDMKVPYSESEITESIKLIVKKNQMSEGYIRPLLFFGEKIGLVNLELDVHLAILTIPFGSYLGEEPVKVKIPSIIRTHPKSTIAGAKISGFYANSILASAEVKKQGYDEALLLDSEGNITEGPGENFFIVKEDRLVTATQDRALPGITRDTIIQIAKDNGIEVIERNITKEEAYSSDEAFFTGTAAEVTPIKSIDDKTIGNGEIGNVTQKLKKVFDESKVGNNEKYSNWLTYIE